MASRLVTENIQALFCPCANPVPGGGYTQRRNRSCPLLQCVAIWINVFRDVSAQSLLNYQNDNLYFSKKRHTSSHGWWKDINRSSAYPQCIAKLESYVGTTFSKNYKYTKHIFKYICAWTVYSIWMETFLMPYSTFRLLQAKIRYTHMRVYGNGHL